MADTRSICQDIFIAICKYSASSISACINILIQLDVCLKGLVVALDVHYDGFIGLCASMYVWFELLRMFFDG